MLGSKQVLLSFYLAGRWLAIAIPPAAAWGGGRGCRISDLRQHGGRGSCAPGSSITAGRETALASGRRRLPSAGRTRPASAYGRSTAPRAGGGRRRTAGQCARAREKR